MRTGLRLIREIDGAQPGNGEAAIWWLGQQSFVVKLGGRVLYLDPFLSPVPGRRVPPLLRPEDVTNAGLVFGSHDHLDHIDREAWPGLAAASPEARFVVPTLLKARLAKELCLPPARLLGVDDGTSVEWDGLRITGIAAAHELLEPDPASGRYPCLGFVIEGHRLALYHAGDCCLYEGLQTRLQRWRLDVVFLPINGRDAKRLAGGCIGNMTYQEAADLAGALRPGLTIPAHYEMFAGNSEDPRRFADYMRVKYPALAVRICRHGERFMTGRRTARKRVRRREA